MIQKAKKCAVGVLVSQKSIMVVSRLFCLIYSQFLFTETMTLVSQCLILTTRTACFSDCNISGHLQYFARINADWSSRVGWVFFQASVCIKKWNSPVVMSVKNTDLVRLVLMMSMVDSANTFVNMLNLLTRINHCSHICCWLLPLVAVHQQCLTFDDSVYLTDYRFGECRGWGQ